MSDGMQITIPDFDDDDYGSSSIPFGRPGGGNSFGGSGFGSGGGGFGAALSAAPESPTLMTPVPDRNDRFFFGQHSRGDSVTSIESTTSISASKYPNKSQTSFGHSSQTSIATPISSSVASSSGFTKKPSFASIRNAFKTGKNSEAPPVPSLDYQSSYVMKTPFNNRSTSSLGQSSPAAMRSGNSAFAFGRPSTPSSTTRGTNKSRGHTPAKSYHSQSGSVYHSDGGSDGHGGYMGPMSPPPVPRVPNGIDHWNRSDTPDVEDDKIIMDPKTPSDFALHAVFIRFAAIAEAKVDTFLRQTLEHDILLEDFMGPDVDKGLEQTLTSLGQIAHKHTKPVIDSIMRWRRSHLDNVGSDVIRTHTASRSGSIRSHDIPGLLNERKSLAAIYIMCRALIAVLQELPKDALGESTGYTLEKMIFDQFRRPDLKLLSQSVNHRTNAELYAKLLGHLANVRFGSVTDRFLAELGPLSQGDVPKDLDMKYENLVTGIRHIQIKVWPPEAFEDGAEFMELLSKSFAHAHGYKLKCAFAESLVHILHPISKTAQAETNHPQWAKAIDTIYPKAREMMSKPRYWHVAFPLVITSLCVAPEAHFKKHWQSVFESAFPKMKEKSLRLPIMNGLLRLLWTYLYRCQEAASTTATKLEGLLKHFFPPNRVGIVPQDDHLEPFIYIVHFVLSRHFDIGRDLVLDLIQEPLIRQNSGISNNINGLAPERIAIAVQAVLLSLHVHERDVATPTWPTETDFSVVPSSSDYPSSSETITPQALGKPGMQDFYNRFASTLNTIAAACASVAGSMSIFDEQYSYSRFNLTYEESSNYIIRRHPEAGSVMYPNNLMSQISVLQTCFQAWPRLLDSSLGSEEDAIDMLLNGVLHVEPLVGESAGEALRRLIEQPANTRAVLERFNIFLFASIKGPAPSSGSVDGTGVKLLVESNQLLDLWRTAVETWLRNVLKTPIADEDIPDVQARCSEIEAAALFLLSHEMNGLRAAGVEVVKLLKQVGDYLKRGIGFLELLHGNGVDRSVYLEGYDELLEDSALSRLKQWRLSKEKNVPLLVASNTDAKDRHIWRHTFPILIQSVSTDSDPYPESLIVLREILINASSRYHPVISHLAGLSSRVPAALSTSGSKDGSRLVREYRTLIDQWYTWIKILCATATLPDQSRPALTNLGREHSRAPSDANFQKERFSTTRGLFRYLTPFLDSEYTVFRDAAVSCISVFPSSAYPQLLEDLSLLAGRQFYDDPRNKAGTPLLPVESSMGMSVLTNRQVYDKSMAFASGERVRRQERLHSAVAHIYYLTAHHLRGQRGASKQAALSNVLKFVRNTQTFLTAPEMRDNHSLQRLRRYFCGTVERLFDGLNSLEGVDRFIPSQMHLTLYRLCEEWCQFGIQSETNKQRLMMMQRAVAAAAPSQIGADELVEKFQNETLQLSYASVGALSSLCPKAYCPPGISSGSPTDRQTPEHHRRPLTFSGVLDRLGAIFASSHLPSQERAKKALKSLLRSDSIDTTLKDECLRRAVMMDEHLDPGADLFFQVISEHICNNESHGFSFSQAICLGLANLCHPEAPVRRQAFEILDCTHQWSNGLLSMMHLESLVCSLATGTYVKAHRLVSDFLAGEHPQLATDILSRLALWLPQFRSAPTFHTVSLLLLQSLELWISNVELMTEDKTGLSHEGHSAIYHLMALSLRYGQTHTEQVLTLWTRLVEHPRESNGHATVRFLLEQSSKVGSSIFVSISANIVACLCQASIGPLIFEELCSVIEPARMLPTIEHKLAFPEAHDMELWQDLDALFSDGQPRLSLGSAQFAWLFLSDVTLERCWDHKAQLPLLLHALFTHIDHRQSFVAERAKNMLFVMLRSWIAGYDELPDRTKNKAVMKEVITLFEKDADEKYWTEAEADPEEKMKWLGDQVINILEPLCPSLREKWGSLALLWGTACSIRAVAFRSLQIFRALGPKAKKLDLANLLGRLSNTIGAADDNIQTFSCEIVSTVKSIAASLDFDVSFLPQIFWTGVACLSTPVEKEFVEVLGFMEELIPRIDFDDPAVVEALLNERPMEWRGSASLQSPLLAGLRSAKTSQRTMHVLQLFAQVKDGRAIDSGEARLRDLYTASLPWCLNAMSSEKGPHAELRELAQNISDLAKREGRVSIQRIMTSFSKSHFRTRDDFLRQSVASLREHYGADHWTDITTLLMGLVLNQEHWLKIQTMQILKVLFQQRETRNPFDLLGSELLTPLLRLLESELAPQALDVLEEPMIMSGGLAAKQVLRMSMHTKVRPMVQEHDSGATVFGIPEESGWTVEKADERRDMARANIMAIFGTCSLNSRPSQIEFEPEVEAFSSRNRTTVMTQGEDLGGLVQNLHDLTEFFQDERMTPAHRPNRQSRQETNDMRRLEARVAAILAKSATESDIPPTPFVDIFRVGPADSEEEHESDYSGSDGSDSEMDAFIFDSPVNMYRSAPNGERYH